MKNQIRNLLCALSLLALLPLQAYADYVGEVQTTKYLDPATTAMISQRLQSGQTGIQVGDEISYYIHFTPVDGGGIVGAGGYVTDYIPSGTQVVGAQFVQINANGGYVQVAPPPPPPVLSGLVPVYSETGIFYSTDPRTSKYTSDGSPSITQTNGYLAGVDKFTGQTTTHNFWDWQMYITYSGTARTLKNPGVCPAVGNWVATLGASPVAGTDAVLQNDYAGVGPWKRISYPGSYFGTMTGVLDAASGGCVGGVPTSAGWNLSPTNPLPANTTAVRFVGGRVTVGQLFAVRITLKVTQPIPPSGLTNATEVFGGDAAIKAGGAVVGKDNPWKYHFPSVANSDSSLTVVKRVVGMCVGVGCIPQAFSGGAVPAAANLKLRYEITYMNTSGSFQTGAQLSDLLPTGGALVAGSALVKSGANILPTSAIAGGFNFQPLAVLGSGSGGAVQFDVNFAAAPPTNLPLMNKARLTSTALPGGVESVATVTPTTSANLNPQVTTTTPTVAPGGTASYTISIPNLGLAAASAISVINTLPAAGGATVAERFTFQPPVPGAMCGAVALTAGQVCGSLVNGATVTPTVLTVTTAIPVVGPYAGTNREQVTFTPPVGFTIPSGARLDIPFNATVGTNVPASASAYTDDVKVNYTGGSVPSAEVAGIAPVTVETPLQVVVAIDCVYSGATCVSYSGGFVPSNSKLRYRLDYVNNGGTAQSNVSLKNTLPTGTTLVTGSDTYTGANLGPVAVVGQSMTFTTLSSLAAGASGQAFFDVQLGVTNTSGTYITDTANISSTVYPGGSSSSLTTSILDSANLTVSKTTSTPTLGIGGVATYKLTVTNTGNTAASSIIVHDELPFTGTLANALARFNYNVGTASVTGMAVAPTITAVAPPTLPGYTTQTNRQEVKFDFGVQTLAPGASFTIDYSATAGNAIPAGSTVHYSDAIAQYASGLSTGLYASHLNAAPITIPSGLAITTSIDCVYSGATCVPYAGSGIVPVNAKVRYKTVYQNTGVTALTNVYLCDQLSSTQAAPAFTATLAQPGGDAPAIGVPAAIAVGSPAAMACGYVAGATNIFAYPPIASLAAGASGTTYYDATTNAAGNATLANAGTIGVAAGREAASVAAYVSDVPQLAITKSVSPAALHAGQNTIYTIKLRNNGSTATGSLQVYDFLPFDGSTADAAKRFAWISNGAVSCAPVIGCPAILPAATVLNPPALSPYSTNPNQQQVLWDFGALALQPGQEMTFSFTASAGANLSAGNYGNGVRAVFTSAVGAGSADALPSDTSDEVTVADFFADIVLTKTNGVAALAAGSATTYTITVTNNGPDTASGIKIKDAVAAGLNKTSVSCSSSGISCPIIATLTDLEAGGLTLTPFGAGATATITVQADVTASSGTVSNVVSAVLPPNTGDPDTVTPLTVADTDNVVVSDLSVASTLTWVDTNGGSHEPGDVIEFTLNLLETNGLAATNVSVLDLLPAGLTGLTGVIVPTGATDNSSATQLDVTGVNVPAGGTVQIKFRATITAGTVTGTAISNSASVDNPTGLGGNVPASPIIVGTPSATGMKHLYLSNAQAAAPAAVCTMANAPAVPLACSLSRDSTTVNTTALNITRGGNAIWQLTPALQAAMTLDGTITPAPNVNKVPVTLNISTSRNGLKLQLDMYCSSTPATVATLPVVTLGNIATATAQTFYIPLPLAGTMSCPAGSSWMLKATHVGGVRANRWITVTPVAGVSVSNLMLPSLNVINVDSVSAYNAVYPATGTTTKYSGGQIVYARAVVSDPFGSFDITAAKATIKDSAGVVRVNAAAMTMVADSSVPPLIGATKTFEYAYTIPSGVPGGVWSVDVTADEGTEGIISHTRAGGFEVAPPVDHYELTVPADSVSCEPATILVKACLDSSNPCTNVATGINGTVSLATTSGTLTQPVGGVVLTNGEGSATLAHPGAAEGATATVSITAVSESASNAYTCSGGSCTSTFHTAGFIVAGVAGGPEFQIPQQVAGVDSAQFQLRAVRTNTATGVCMAALTGAQTVNVGYECVDPGTCAGADHLTVAGVTVPRNNSGTSANQTATDLTFDANGNASFTLNYRDVGDIRLHLGKADVNQSGVGAGANLVGQSLPFRTVPYAFELMACSGAGPCTTANASPVDGTGSVIAKAGDAFSLSVRALAASCTTAPCVVPSFGSAASGSAGSENVTLTWAQQGSGLTVPGTLSTTTIARSSFTNGVATVSETYDEVGVIQVTANDATTDKFMGAVYGATGTSGNIGRFTPHHFDTVVEGTMSCASGQVCPTSVNPMVYSGQTLAQTTVTAKNAIATTVAGVTTYGTTTNYKYVSPTVSFAKDITLSAVDASTGNTSVSGGTLGGTLTLPATSFTGSGSGELTDVDSGAPSFTFSGTPKFTLTASTTPAPVNFYLHAVESSGSDLVKSEGTGAKQGGARSVAGRIKVSNAYGSGLVKLPIPVEIQFYDGSVWTKSTMDSITKIDPDADPAGNFSPTGMAVTPTSTDPGTTPLSVSGGTLQGFELKAPGASGKATISFTSPSGVRDIGYLLTNAIVTGEAVFGIYPGKKPFIYLRESY